MYSVLLQPLHPQPLQARTLIIQYAFGKSW